MLYQKLNASTIRLLRLHTGGDTNQVLGGNLEEHGVDSAPSFQCLSYAWGEAPNVTSVRVNGQPFEISQNLCDAIKAIPHSSSPILLWVDKICVNQNDDTERSSQVKLMRNIYIRASVVNIWLGNGIPGVRVALDLLSRLVRDPSALAEAMIQDGDQDISRVKTIRQLFQSPWWSRLWVIQEALLASVATVYCGQCSIPFNEMIQAFETIWNEHITHGQRLRALPGGHEIEPLMRCLELSARRLHIVNNFVFVDRPNGTRSFRKSKASLPFLLHSCSWAQCSDPRDKVYGTLGLLNEDLLEPDYTLPISKVYARSTFTIMKAMGNMAILTQKTFDIENELALPTWVPDWTKPSALTAHLLVFRNLYFASQSLNPGLALLADSILVIDALEVDEISEVGSTFDTVDITRAAELPLLLQPVLTEWLEMFQRVTKGQRTPMTKKNDAGVSKRRCVGSGHSLLVDRLPTPLAYRDGSVLPERYPMQSMEAPLYGDADYSNPSHAMSSALSNPGLPSGLRMKAIGRNIDPKAPYNIPESLRTPPFRDADYSVFPAICPQPNSAATQNEPDYVMPSESMMSTIHSNTISQMPTKGDRAPLYQDADLRTSSVQSHTYEDADYRTSTSRQFQQQQQQHRMHQTRNGVNPPPVSPPLQKPRPIPPSPKPSRIPYRIYDASTHTYIFRPPFSQTTSSSSTMTNSQDPPRRVLPESFWRTLCLDVIDSPSGGSSGNQSHRRCTPLDRTRFHEWWDWIFLLPPSGRQRNPESPQRQQQRQHQQEKAADDSNNNCQLNNNNIKDDGTTTTTTSTNKTIPQLHWHMNVVLQRKRFFVTKKGSMGVADRAVRKGDRVCVFRGEALSYILRPLDGDRDTGGGGEQEKMSRSSPGRKRYELVAPAYVHGIMDGQRDEEQAYTKVEIV